MKTKKKIVKEPIPTKGEIYNYFDDGKIREDRRESVLIKSIIPVDKINSDVFMTWKNDVKECDWLYAKETDCFIEGHLTESNYDLIFARTIDGGWFSFGHFLLDGRLDVSGKRTKILKERG